AMAPKQPSESAGQRALNSLMSQSERELYEKQIDEIRKWLVVPPRATDLILGYLPLFWPLFWTKQNTIKLGLNLKLREMPLNIAHDGRTFIIGKIGQNKNIIQLRDLQTGDIIKQISSPYHDNYPIFSPNNKLVSLVDLGDKKIKILNMRTGKLIQT